MDFTANARDGSGRQDACGNGCCCEQGQIAPGEKAIVRINYAHWIAQLRARGLVKHVDISVSLVPAGGCAVPGADLSFAVAAPSTLNGSAAQVQDLAGATYALAILPTLGAVVLQSNGAFSYSVGAGEAGEDYFSVAVVAPNGSTFVRRVGVNVSLIADFAFIANPESQFTASIAPPAGAPNADPANSCYQIASGAPGAAIYLEPSWNGPQALATAPLLAAAAAIGAPGSATAVRTKLGVVQLTNLGALLYTPNEGVSGLDVFTVNVCGPSGAVIRTRIVSIQLPDVWVDLSRLNVSSPFLSFPVSAQKDASIGDTFRITVLQDAQDCNGSNFTHSSCYDVSVAKC